MRRFLRRRNCEVRAWDRGEALVCAAGEGGAGDGYHCVHGLVGRGDGGGVAGCAAGGDGEGIGGGGAVGDGQVHGDREGCPLGEACLYGPVLVAFKVDREVEPVAPRLGSDVVAGVLQEVDLREVAHAGEEVVGEVPQFVELQAQGSEFGCVGEQVCRDSAEVVVG